MNLTCDGLLPVAAIAGFSACSFLNGKDGRKCRTLGGCSLVGDPRGDDNVPLHAMHTVWLREHNRIVGELRKINPTMTDKEKLYQTARKIVTGIWAHLAYDEYLPDLVKLPTYTNYDDTVEPTIINSFAAAAFRYGHSLVPNSFDQNNNAFNPIDDPIPLRDALFNREPINFRGIEPTWFGLTGNKSCSARVDNQFAEGISRYLFVRPMEKLYRDLLAINIQRGRDHGLKTYGDYRDYCGLTKLNNWAEANKVFFPGVATRLQTIFKFPNDIDLYAAGVSEIHAKDSELGPTFQCLVKKQFEAIRNGDRFFWRNKGVFTDKQKAAIEKVTFASILCANLKNIISIQPKALKIPDEGDNRRVNCDSGKIPKLDLSAWKID